MNKKKITLSVLLTVLITATASGNTIVDQFDSFEYNDITEKWNGSGEYSTVTDSDAIDGDMIAQTDRFSNESFGGSNIERNNIFADANNRPSTLKFSYRIDEYEDYNNNPQIVYFNKYITGGAGDIIYGMHVALPNKAHGLITDGGSSQQKLHDGITEGKWYTVKLDGITYNETHAKASYVYFNGDLVAEDVASTVNGDNNITGFRSDSNLDSSSNYTFQGSLDYILVDESVKTIESSSEDTGTFENIIAMIMVIAVVGVLFKEL